jgi:Ca2+-binding RTX toxin-like protein
VYLRTAAGNVTTADGRKWERMGTGSITFRAGDLLDPTTWQADVPDDVSDAIVDRALSVTSLIEGIRALLAEARAAMDGAANGQQVPVVGQALDAGSAAVEKLDQAAAALEQLAAAVESQATAGNVRNAVRNFLSTRLGALGILLGTPEVVVECGDAVCADSAPVLDVTDVSVRFSLGKGATATTPTVATGVPGLAVGTDAKASASVAWRLDVAVGVDRDGFYLDPTNASGRPAELTVDATASVPSSFDGTLAGLPVHLSEDPGPDLTLHLGADLLGSAPIRLPELIERGADVLDPSSVMLTAQGCADLDLAFDVRLPVNDDPPTALPGLEGVIDLLVDWNGCGATGDPVDIRDGLDAVGTLAIRDVRLDAGRTVTDLVGPVLGNLQHLTMPMQPVVDKVTSPIPVVSDLARMVGRDEVTWLDAFEAQQAASGNDVTAITTLVRLIDYVNAFDAASQPNLTVPVVDRLDVDLNAAGRHYADPQQAIDEMIGQIPELNDVRADLEAAGWTIETDIAEVAPEEGGASFTFPVIEDPVLLVQLLFGKDVDLAVFDAGPLRADAPFDYAYGLPFAKVGIRGTAAVEGHFAVSYDTAGIRRLVAERPLQLSSLGALVHGLAIDDLDASGADVPEIRLDANVTAYAYAGVPGANIEASGGVRGFAQANLHDEDGDGKLRYEEVRSRIQDPLCLFDIDGRIAAFLQVTGQLGFLRGTRQIVPPFVLLSYQSGPDGACGLIGGGDPNDPDPPEGTTLELARQQGAGLDLNVGLAADLLDGEYDDPDHPADRAEHVTVTDHGNGSVTVTLEGASKRYGDAQHPIAELFANFGIGDDTFEMVRSPNAGPRPPVIAHVQMGSGNDVVIGGPANDSIVGETGDDVLRGGPGNDTIVGSEGNDTIYGETGNDPALNGGPGADHIEGGDGSDGLRPGDGADVLIGGVGNDSLGDSFPGSSATTSGPDVMDGGPGADGLIGSSNGDLLIGGVDETPTTSQDDHIMGRGGNDCIVGDGGVAPDLAELQGPVCLGLVSLDGPGGSDYGIGEDGDDVIVTGGGFSETLLGGNGNDWLDGGSGTNKLVGDAGDDTLIAREGNDTLEGGTGNDVMFAGEGVDTLTGQVGNDAMYGEGGNESSFQGGDGDDVMDGGPGNDTLRAGNGNDVAVGDAGTDQVFGDAGNDRVEGDADADQVYGDGSLTAGTTTDGNDLVTGGPGNDTILAGRGDDFVDTGSGDDTADAGAGNDRVAGGPGSDRLHGKAGDDTVDGGPGNDAVAGDSVTLTEATNPPSTWPNGALRLRPSFDATIGGDDVLVGGGGEDFAYDTVLTPPSSASMSNVRLTVTDPADHGATGTTATQFVYTPAAGYQGSDSVGYRLTNSTTGALVAEGRVSVTYLTNRPPVANGDTVTTDQGRPVTADALGNDTDPDGDALAATALDAGTAHGHVVLDPDGRFTYTPDPDFAGADGFDYTIADDRGLTATGHVTVNVRPDLAGPAVACEQPSGWSAEEVTVGCVASDGGSGLADPDQASFELTTAMGVGLEGGYPLDPPAVCDRAGNCTDRAPFEVLVDRKGPEVTSATDGTTFGPGTATITAEVACADAGSGVADGGCPDHGRSLDTSPGEHTFTATGTDRVGNATTRTFRYAVAAADLPTVSVGDASVVEGRRGTRRVYVPVTLDRAVDTPVSVIASVKDGTATVGGDVRGPLAPSVVRFEPGPRGVGPVQRYVVVEVLPDFLVEGDETLDVLLTDPSGAELGRAAGTITILDDDPSGTGATVSVGDATVVEGDKDARRARVAVTLSGPATAPVTVTAVFRAGAFLDTARVTFEAGQVSGYADVPVLPDVEVDGDQGIEVRLLSRDVPVHRAIGKVTVLDDDGLS